MINALLYFITGFLPCRIIMVNKEPYLERYFITEKIFLHRFITSDGDRHIHDHPWYWAFSIILTGFYYEKLLDDNVVTRRWFNYIDSSYMHRITYIKPKTWTLFVTSKRTHNGWGFLDDNGVYKVMPSPSDSKGYTRHDYPKGRACDRRPL